MRPRITVGHHDSGPVTIPANGITFVAGRCGSGKSNLLRVAEGWREDSMPDLRLVTIADDFGWTTFAGGADLTVEDGRQLVKAIDEDVRDAGRPTLYLADADLTVRRWSEDAGFGRELAGLASRVLEAGSGVVMVAGQRPDRALQACFKVLAERHPWQAALAVTARGEMRGGGDLEEALARLLDRPGGAFSRAVPEAVYRVGVIEGTPGGFAESSGFAPLAPLR